MEQAYLWAPEIDWQQEICSRHDGMVEPKNVFPKELF